MKLYLIGGLGADERVFKYCNLNTNTQIIHWLNPKPKEKISSYASRLLEQIDSTEPFGILGVSFGGIVAMEISKLVKPKLLILVSSVSVDSQLPQRYLILGKTRILNLIPDFLIKPPTKFLSFLFGAKNEKLLSAIIDDTAPTFIRWALNEIIHWKNDEQVIQPIRIHGTRDKLIPLKGQAIKVQDGGHFMIVDKAKEISNLVNGILVDMI